MDGEAVRDGTTDLVKKRVFAATREAIVSRQLPPGTKLTEDVTAETFSCGRVPCAGPLPDLATRG